MGPAVLDYLGPDYGRRVTALVANSIVGYVDLDRAAICLVPKAGEPLEARESATASSAYHFADVPDGEYDLVIADDRFEPFRQTGVRPGDDVFVTLEGNAAVRLQVVERETGNEVQVYGLWLEYVRESFSSTWRNQAGTSTAAPSSLRLCTLLRV